MFLKDLSNLKRNSTLALGVALLMASTPSLAGKDKRHGPPPAALEACEALAPGDACEFTGRKGDVAGTCFAPTEEHPLACRPAKSKKKSQDRDSEPAEAE